ncbi:polycomb protein EED [Vairimorpha necatrix]|uniref:Polycomb protein EED n=1 Tax=Vairimorpha necatrix TaxID=6039 RepID=A0AAX4JGA7_9MICR
MTNKLYISECNLKVIRSHPTKNILVALGQRTIVILQMINNNLVIKMRFVDENEKEFYSCLDFLDYNDKFYVVFGGKCGIIKILDLTIGKFYGFIDAHEEITDIKVMGTLIASCGTDLSIKIWDFNTFKCINTFTGHDEVVLKLDLKDDLLVSAGMDQKILIWDIKKSPSYEPMFIIENLHKELILKTFFYGTLIIALTKDNMITICRINDTGKESSNRNFLLIKTLHYADIVDIDIMEHSLICFSQSIGLFMIDLLSILDTVKVKHIEKSSDLGLCVTSNKKNIFVLYEDNLIEAFQIN